MRILSAKYLITMAGEPIMDGAVAIEGDEIVDVGQEEDLLNRYKTASHEDYPTHVILPGLINCHTHLDLSLHKDFPGDPVRSEKPSGFIDWLLGCLEHKKNAESSHLYQAVESGIDACQESGTTCVADMSNYDGIFDVFEQKKMRAVVFPEILSLDSDITKNMFESALAIIEKYAEDESDLISVGAAPYSPYTLSRNILRIMSQYCYTSEIPCMIHASESFSEMEFFHDSSGDIATKLFPRIGWNEMPPEHRITPIEYLLKVGFLISSPLLVGCTQLTTKDLELISKSVSKVVITPRSHENLGQGVVAYRAMVEQNIVTVLGTDGIPSVQTLSLWDEMRAFVRQHEHTTKLTGAEVLAMVTTNAAIALGIDGDVGSIEKGKKADLVLADISSIPTGGDLLMNLIQGINNYHIKSVLINGENVKSMN
jgi:aminodeoxyfutalosine deaminase